MLQLITCVNAAKKVGNHVPGNNHCCLRCALWYYVCARLPSSGAYAVMSLHDKLGMARAFRKRIRRTGVSNVMTSNRLYLWRKHWDLLVDIFGEEGAYREQDRLEGCTPFRYFETLGDTWELRMYYGRNIRFVSHEGVRYV